jgi:hypothetical protein
MAKEIKVILAGGLGNQLFQLAGGISKAGDSNLEILFGITSCALGPDGFPIIKSYLKNDSQIRYRELRYFFLWKIIVNITLRIRGGHFGKIFLNFDSQLNQALTGIINLYVHGTSRSQEVSQGQLEVLVGYFQSEEFVGESVTRLRELATSDQESHWVKEMRLKSKIEFPLVVHVRLGDYLKEENIGVPTKLYFAAAIEKAWESGHYKKIWLFSNDNDTVIEFIPEWCIPFCEVIKHPNDDDLETFDVMRLGSGFVISNSTFSWWAARLAHDFEARVFAPYPWFANLSFLEGIYPNSWRKIPSGY